MIRVHKIKSEDSLWPKNGRWVPTDPQQLTKWFQEGTLGACAKAHANTMIAREVDHRYLLGFWINGTDVPVVTEVDDEPKTFEGCALKKSTIPRLRLSQRK